MNARDLRLQADYESILKLVGYSKDALRIDSTAGKPPDTYLITFRCRSIVELKDGKPTYGSIHKLRVRLPARYPLPSAPPRLDFVTPIWNPHVYLNMQVCLGRWQTTEYLDELIARVGALIQFDRRILNLRDPANPPAMEWVQKNFLLLPTDNQIFGHPEIEISLSDPIQALNDLSSPQSPDSEIDWVEG